MSKYIGVSMVIGAFSMLDALGSHFIGWKIMNGALLFAVVLTVLIVGGVVIATQPPKENK